MRKKATSTAMPTEQDTPARRLHLVGKTDLDDDSAGFDEPETTEEHDDLSGKEKQLIENDPHGESDPSSREMESAEDLVGVYLREMGVTPMLTREGETANM